MTDIGTVGYLAGALSYFILSVLLLTRWRDRTDFKFLLLPALLSALWCLALAYQISLHKARLPFIYHGLEILRDGAWLVFLRSLISHQTGKDEHARSLVRGLTWTGIAVIAVPFLWVAANTLLADRMAAGVSVQVLFLGLILLALFGLFLVEQLFRNTPPEQRWGIKFLCVGIGALFAYDFYLYSETLLFQKINLTLWQARGAINALVVPMLAIAVARAARGHSAINLSRGMMLRTATLLGAGIYLLAMSAAGAYIRIYGGSWGGVIQIIFLFGALLLLAVLMFSGQLRAHVKVLLSKHFVGYRYDYREEWLGFTRTLASCKSDFSPHECIMRAIAALVESPGGLLWLRGNDEVFTLVARWNIPEPKTAIEPAAGPWVKFMEEKQWVVDLDEYALDAEIYSGLALPDWLAHIERPWLIAPLMQERMIGFIVLAQPRAPGSLNWEGSDLLKTAGRQAANLLVQWQTAEALAEARQFEGFNRLSAFVLHDLKNVIAQLSLVASHADKHKENPQFIEDMVGILRHSVNKMNRLMEQLRGGGAREQTTAFDLTQAAGDAVASRSAHAPCPQLHRSAEPIIVHADRERMTAVLTHLIQNAQEATSANGHVDVRLRCAGSRAVIDLEDDGCGMDAAFVRERLFKPFDTTKGDTGMGIGAYESREFVRALGGDVFVHTAPGQGTRFSIELPLA